LSRLDDANEIVVRFLPRPRVDHAQGRVCIKREDVAGRRAERLERFPKPGPAVNLRQLLSPVETAERD
jgi:hypothetical protein